MMDVENEVFKVRVKEVMSCGGVVLSLRVRGDNNWIFVNDIVLHEGDSAIFCDGLEGEECGLFESFPRETWTEAIRDGTLDV